MSRITINESHPTLATPNNILWDDLRVSLSRATTGSTPATLAAFIGNTQAFSFSASQMNQLFFDMQLSHAWDAETDIHPHIHWSPGNSTNAGVVRWGLEYSWANAVAAPGNVFPATQTVYVEQAAAGVAYSHQIAEFPVISGVGKRLSSVLICRLFRDATHINDTFTAVSFGLSFDTHIQLSANGSTTEYAGAI